MANIRTLQLSFGGGEVTPEFFGRIDDAKFRSGLALCKNFMVLPHGPVQNRPGFAYVREAKFSDKPSRLIRFSYSATQTMVMEFGEKYVRFHTQGATLINEDGTPYEVETPYSAQDVFDLRTVQSSDVLTIVHPKYAPAELKRYGSLDWRYSVIKFASSLNPPESITATAKKADNPNNQIDYNYKVSVVGADGIEESLPSIKATCTNNLLQTGAYNDIAWSAVANARRYNVYKQVYTSIYAYIGQTDTLTFRDDNITADISVTPPEANDPFTANGISSVEVKNGGSGYGTTATGGEITSVGVLATGGGYYSPVLTVSDPNGKGASFTLRTERDQEWSPTVKIVGVTVDAKGSGYTSPTFIISDENGGENPGSGARFTATISPILNGVKLELTDPTGKGASVSPVIDGGVIKSVQVNNQGSDYSDPKITVKEAAGGSGAEFGEIKLTGTNNFPSAVSYFEQRRVFAGTVNQPSNIWMTRSGTESNMSQSLPVRDDDSIQFKVAARESNAIRHIVPLSTMVLLTGSAEWRVTSVNSDAITPTSISVRPQSYIGANNIEPVIINNNMVYAAARGGHMRELSYSWQANGFVTGDLSLRAPHLFDYATVVDIDYAKAPQPIVWVVSSTGKLLGLTYVPEQQVGAWHQHETNGAFESVATVAEGEEDVVYAVVKREINGKSVRMIERMHTRKFPAIEDAFFVDCGATYDGNVTDAKGVVKGPVTKITGLKWLEGCEVSILGDGAVIPSQVVKDGTVTLPVPCMKVHVGLPYVSDAKTLPWAAQLDAAYGQGRMKNVNKVWVRVYRSSGLFVGPSENMLTEAKQRTNEPYGSPPELKSEEVMVMITPSWEDSGQVFVRQVDPLPLTLVSMSMEVAIGS